ncbi:MAG: ROK family protein [Methylophilus sp.]|jgi:glucokinase
MARSIGVDVGGTNLRVGVFDCNQLLQETRFQADFSAICKQNPPDVAWQLILEAMAAGIQNVLKLYPDVQTIGIGFPGFIDPTTQTIAQSPNLPGLINVNLAHDLASKLGKTVVVENDANAAAYGEYCLADKPAGGLVYLGLGTGVGGGLILPNVKQQAKPYVGQHGCAMEAGHIIVEHNGRSCGCGNYGCMEQYASASGVSISYFNATQQQHSAAEIAKLAQAGDAFAILAYETAAQALAQALASILKVADVEHVVIGGGMVAAWGLMQNAFTQRLNQDLIPVLRGKITITSSIAQDVAGMLGAAMLAVDS